MSEASEQNKGIVLLPSGTVAKSFEDGSMQRIEGYKELDAQLREQEHLLWLNTLGADVDIKPLPEVITPEVVRNLRGIGMVLRYVPKLDLRPDSLKSRELTGFFNELTSLYPDWKNINDLSLSEKTDHVISRNLVSTYWEWVRDNALEFPSLPGQWVAVESDEFSSEMMTRMLNIEDRFNWSWDKVNKVIDRSKDDILTNAGLHNSDANIRLPTAIEYNLLGNREAWGRHKYYEWLQDKVVFSVNEYGYLHSGYYKAGGVGDIRWSRQGNGYNFIGFRLTIVF